MIIKPEFFLYYEVWPSEKQGYLPSMFDVVEQRKNPKKNILSISTINLRIKAK